MCFFVGIARGSSHLGGRGAELRKETGIFGGRRRIKLSMRGEDKGNILAICAVVLCVMLTLGLCFALSGQGFIGALLLEGVESESIYFVCAGPYDELALARSSAELVRDRGGAGYMLKDGSYELVYAAYSDSSDAERVSGDIAGTYVKRIDIKKSRLKWAKNEMREAALAALKYFPLEFSALSDCANGLNAGELTLQDVKIKIGVLRQQIEEIKSVFCEIATDSDAYASEIELALLTALALADNVELGFGEARALSSLRYAAVQLTLSRQALMNKL